VHACAGAPNAYALQLVHERAKLFCVIRACMRCIWIGATSCDAHAPEQHHHQHLTERRNTCRTDQSLSGSCAPTNQSPVVAPVTACVRCSKVSSVRTCKPTAGLTLRVSSVIFEKRCTPNLSFRSTKQAICLPLCG
jgi:hypothetical protein